MSVPAIVDLASLLSLLIVGIFIAVVDIKQKRIPNKSLAILIGLWFVFQITKIAHIYISDNINMLENFLLYCVNCIINCIIVFLFLYFIRFVTSKLSHTTGNEIFGMGDIKLLSVLSLYLGFYSTLICLLIACVAFVIYWLINRLILHKLTNKVSFAPFILAGLIFNVIYLVVCNNYLCCLCK